ncbi:hypothetical protein [Actinoplanes siamensis]|uniref:Uncharacterized protein n=1 Tax=Actinoplanes siamensis TaxID=1223317 RepID=A0A919NFH6_9ACTN|nr:hypothetical protein [Actinoplanes siamensis]GIF09916.1 hypothetical protein Asi03nite_74540 [Actinoplanes siamensis]
MTDKRRRTPAERRRRQQWLIPLGYFCGALLFLAGSDGWFRRCLAIVMMLYSAVVLVRVVRTQHREA